MKDALFIVPHDIYIGRALYEVRLGALRYEEKNSAETPNNSPCSLTQIGNLSLYRFCLPAEHLAFLVLEGVAGNVKRIRKARCSTDKRRVNKKQGKQLKNVWISGLITDRTLSSCFLTCCRKSSACS